MKFTEVLKAYRDVFTHLGWAAIQLPYGIWKLSRLDQPRVSIFGGAKLPVDSPYNVSARELASKLVDANISVITGGGPGVMEAANCGARRNGKSIRSIGIGVKGLEGGKLNPCVETYMVMHYYFPRMWLLTRFSIAFVIFPGGVGTLEELMELMTLIQTGMRERAPIVLFGKDYWAYIVKWLESALEQNLILKSDYDNLTVTDDLDEVFNIVKNHCDSCK